MEFTAQYLADNGETKTVQAELIATDGRTEIAETHSGEFIQRDNQTNDHWEWVSPEHVWEFQGKIGHNNED